MKKKGVILIVVLIFIGIFGLLLAQVLGRLHLEILLNRRFEVLQERVEKESQLRSFWTGSTKEETIQQFIATSRRMLGKKQWKLRDYAKGRELLGEIQPREGVFHLSLKDNRTSIIEGNGRLYQSFVYDEEPYVLEGGFPEEFHWTPGASDEWIVIGEGQMIQARREGTDLIFETLNPEGEGEVVAQASMYRRIILENRGTLFIETPVGYQGVVVNDGDILANARLTHKGLWFERGRSQGPIEVFGKVLLEGHEFGGDATYSFEQIVNNGRMWDDLFDVRLEGIVLEPHDYFNQ